MQRNGWSGMVKDWGLALFIAVLAFIAWNIIAGGSSELSEGPAPPIHADALVEGAPGFDLEAHRGSVVVLNYWATWCGPCLAELPELSAWAEAHPDVVLVGLSVDNGLPPARIRGVAQRGGATYPVFHDPTHGSAMGISTLPTTVVVDEEGEIVATHVGGLNRRRLEHLVP